MTTLKQALRKKLSKKEIDMLIASYDIIGSIAIIEIPSGLAKKEKLIAETLLGLHKNIRTVLKKAGIHKGTYRRQKLEAIAGEKTKVAEYKENNAILRLDVEKVYFSPRLSTERKRICRLIKAGENVLVMFSGCAPYPLVIAKNTKAKKICGIELNPVAHSFALENVKINKIKNIELFLGDVRKIIPKLEKQKKYFERIIMPLPKGAESFLESAFSVAKKGANIHFYDFAMEGEFNSVREKIKNACKGSSKKCRILKVVKCGQYAPRVFRVCADFKILS